jgi:hypothetical protein
MHLTPGMSFETVQRHAQNLGVSLRQTIQQSAQPAIHKFPPGIKGLLPRGGPVQSVNATETADLDYPQSFVDETNMAASEAALENTHTGNSYTSPSGTPSDSSRQPWRPPMPRSPSSSVLSIPTRGVGKPRWISNIETPFSYGNIPTDSMFPLLRGRTLPLRMPLTDYLPYFNEKRLSIPTLISATSRQPVKITLWKVSITLPGHNKTF